MFIIKLGGSVITDKTKPNQFKPHIVTQLAQEIKEAKQPLILIHGAGSFGHILAKQHKLNQGFKKETQRIGFAQTHAQVQQLNNLILTIFHDQQLPIISLPPHALLQLNNHKPYKFETKIFHSYLHQGFIPITFGDVVLDKVLGFSICSGDLLLQLLTQQFKPTKTIFVIDEDGLYTENPKQNPKAKLIEKTTIKELEKLKTTKNHHADVTKGMEGKLQTIQNVAHMGIDTILVNGNIEKRLYNILTGKPTPHTVIQGGS